MTEDGDPFRLDGRVVIVTGATSGLGVGFAHAVAKAGASVVLAGRRTDRLTQVGESVAKCGAAVRTKTTDVADPDQCAALVAFAQAELGQVDGLVNNAGVGPAQSSARVAIADFRHVIDTNLNGAFWMARESAKSMPAGSSIVNIASVLGLIAPRYPQAAYAASKAGVIGLTRALAQEWSRYRQIRVNALCPGYFRSEMTEVAIEELTDNAARNSMLGRLGTIEELTPALIFLLGPASSYITGITLSVDGGMSAL